MRQALKDCVCSVCGRDFLAKDVRKFCPEHRIVRVFGKTKLIRSLKEFKRVHGKEAADIIPRVSVFTSFQRAPMGAKSEKLLAGILSGKVIGIS